MIVDKLAWVLGVAGIVLSLYVAISSLINAARNSARRAIPR